MNRNKNETLKIIFTLILLILAMVSMTMAIKKGVTGGVDFQWDSAKLLAMRIDPYKASLSETSPYHISEYGVVEANQFPSLLWLLFPYALLDGSVAMIAWLISNLIFLAGIIVLLRTLFWNNLSKIDYVLVVSVLLSSGCIRSQLHLGQHSLFAFFFFLLAVWMSKKGKDVLAGLFLAISYFKYSITAPLMLYFLYKKKYKEVMTSFVPHIVLTLFSSWWLKTDLVTIMLLPLKQATGLSSAGFADIGSLLEKIGIYNMTTIFSVVIFIGLIIWVLRSKKKISDYDMICTLVLWSLVFMYHRRYDYFLLILPFATVFMPDQKTKVWRISIMILTIGVLTIGNFVDLESSIGQKINAILSAYLPYATICNVLNASMILLLYFVLCISHITFENKMTASGGTQNEV